MTRRAPDKPLPAQTTNARLSGDPNVAGGPFVIRIENVDGPIVFPHWHLEDEHIVVVQRTRYLGAGDRFWRSSHRPLTAGPSCNLAELFGYPCVVNGGTC